MRQESDVVQMEKSSGFWLKFSCSGNYRGPAYYNPGRAGDTPQVRDLLSLLPPPRPVPSVLSKQLEPRGAGKPAAGPPEGSLSSRAVTGRLLRGSLTCRHPLSRASNPAICARVRAEELFTGISFKGKEVNDCVKPSFGVGKRLGRTGMLRLGRSLCREGHGGCNPAVVLHVPPGSILPPELGFKLISAA